MKIFGFFSVLVTSLVYFGYTQESKFETLLSEALVKYRSIESLDQLSFDPREEIIHRLQEAPPERLCEAFMKLKLDELAGYADLIDEHLGPAPCYTDLQNRIKAYYGIKSSVFFQVLNKEQNYLIEDKDLPPLNFRVLRALERVGEEQAYFFGGTLPVDTRNGAVIYRNDPIAGGNNRLNLKQGQILLTFDDGPHGSRTMRVKEILDKHQVKAVFFAMGKNAKAHPSIVRNLIASGHVYGSHSNTHKNLPKLSQSAAESEIREGHLNVVAATNQEDSGFFRFPYGSRTTNLVAYLKKNSLASFFWNMDTLDWKLTDPTVLYNHVVNEINREKKGIILFHDIHQQTVIVLDSLLTNLKKAGYTVYLAVPEEWIEAK